MNHSTIQYIVMAALLASASSVLYAANQLADKETTTTAQTQPSEVEVATDETKSIETKPIETKPIKTKVVEAQPTAKPVVSDDGSVNNNDSQTNTNTAAPSVAKSNGQFIPTESISEDLAVSFPVDI